MKSLITLVLLSFFITTEAQNISQSQVRQFNAVPAYRVFGRGAGVGTPSFITLDSNHVPQLHSQGYYDGRFQQLLSLTQGRIPFTGTGGKLVTSSNLLYDSTNSILSVLTNANTKQGITATNSNSGINAMSSIYVTNDIGTVGGIEQGSSNFGTLTARDRTTLVSRKGLAILSDAGVFSGGTHNIQFYAGGSTLMPQMTINSNRHLLIGDSIDLIDVHNYAAQINGNAKVRDTLFANVLSVNGTITGGSGSGTYVLPTASSTTLGGVKVGSGLSIDGTGVLSSSGTGSAQVYYLSKNGVTSDANLSAGSTTFGTDQTAAIQAVLNNGGATNPIIVYWDVKTSVTGLRIKGNTKIIALPGMGAILRNNSNAPLMMNSNVTFGGTIIDSNIVIEGGTWNGNGYNSGLTPAQTKGTAATGLTNVFSFYGVRNLIVRDFVIYRQAVYGIGANTVENALYENGLIDCGSSATVNSDGVHFDGNSKHCTARNLKIKSLDDAVALNADDVYGGSSYGNATVSPFYPLSAAGPISDITVEDIFLDAGLYGVRLLSSSSRVDNVRLKNISGTTNGYGLIIDNYIPNPAALSNTGSGNIGTVQVENFNVGIKATAYVTANAVFGCNIERLILKDFKRNDFTLAVPSILLTNNKTINNLIIDGYDSEGDTTAVNSYSHIVINSGSAITNLSATRVNITKTSTQNNVSFINNSGTVSNFSFNGATAQRLFAFYNSAGTTSSIIGTNLSLTNSTYGFATSPTVPEITLSSYRGGTTLLNGTFTTQKGDAFGGFSNTLLTGTAGGQTAVGGTASGENLTLKPTSANTTTGKVIMGTLGAYDVANNRFGVGTASPSNEIHIQKNVNGLVGQVIENQSAGTTAEAFHFLKSNVVYGGFEAFSSAYSTTTEQTNKLMLTLVTGDALSFATSNSKPIEFYTGSGITAANKRMVILSGGNVGIGTTSPNSTLQTTSFAAGYVAKTAAYTATIGDYTIDCNGTFTVTLPTAIGITGRIYVIKNSGTGTITLAGTSAQTFDGATSPTIATQYGILRIQSNGTNWIIL